MNRAVSILRMIAIVLNALLCVCLTLAICEAGVGGVYLFLMGLVIFTGVLNIVILSTVGRFIVGVCRTVLIFIAAVLNLCSLIGVMTGLVQYGLPEASIAAVAVILWLIFPFISFPALFIAKGGINKTRHGGAITCPNCGTQIQA